MACMSYKIFLVLELGFRIKKIGLYQHDKK